MEDRFVYPTYFFFKLPKFKLKKKKFLASLEKQIRRLGFLEPPRLWGTASLLLFVGRAFSGAPQFLRLPITPDTKAQPFPHL